MSSEARAEDAPIYSRLVRERGDVLTETRNVADQVLRQARDALDWSGVRPAQRQDADRAAFSAFR
ncbi:hypothetical protein [Streptomyces sp. MMBL 11-1]|uniref:hypothetical protein n=1 Tax=Streptomyces sp. MMBL 11-1 TaxID=3026420 RepID=UPI002361401B|nr:hypothetical protein [Streptomyces sp. MMBL 11-1]